MKVGVLTKLDNLIIPCIGNIEVKLINKKQAYITWAIYYKEKLIAAKSYNLFISDEGNPNEILISKILINIEKYRINRKKIFSNVHIIDD